MILTENQLRKKIRSILNEILGAKRKESILQRALGGSGYGSGGGSGYGEYGDDYYDYDYGYSGYSDDDGDGDGDGGED